ncbi:MULTISPECIES: ABC transporter permease [unclassified Actinomyces]|uniref:ABC transporter permease n=1 Tax=unclassified Actinomyces TaxID=2609248 RepID=UPI00131F1038|nr:MULTISPECIES: ABC transporter permease [unclassified Actinomyces]
MNAFMKVARRINVRPQALGTAVSLLAVIVVFSLAAPRFLSASNLTSILYSASLLAIAAVAEAVVLLTGNYDLSVGSIIGLTAYVCYDVTSHAAWSQPLVILVGICFGAILGALNGLLVGYLKVPSMVATLGTLSVYRGLCSLYSGSREVTNDQIPAWLNALAPRSFLGVPFYVWLTLLMVLIMTFLLSSRPWGRKLYAFGANQNAAVSFGLNSRHILLGAYVASGAICGLVGMLMGARVGTINSLLGNGYEMTVIAAAVIGGVSLWGGTGSAVGAMLGALVYACLDNGLVLLGVEEYVRLIFQGVAIVGAIGIDAVVRRKVLRVGQRRAILEATA